MDLLLIQTRPARSWQTQGLFVRTKVPKSIGRAHLSSKTAHDLQVLDKMLQIAENHCSQCLTTATAQLCWTQDNALAMPLHEVEEGTIHTFDAGQCPRESGPASPSF